MTFPTGTFVINISVNQNHPWIGNGLIIVQIGVVLTIGSKMFDCQTPIIFIEQLMLSRIQILFDICLTSHSCEMRMKDWEFENFSSVYVHFCFLFFVVSVMVYESRHVPGMHIRFVCFFLTLVEYISVFYQRFLCISWAYLQKKCNLVSHGCVIWCSLCDVIMMFKVGHMRNWLVGLSDSHLCRILF